MKSTRQVLIIGVGNDYRSDDGVGLAVARRLRGRVATATAIVELSGSVDGLLSAWQQAENAYLVDAMQSGLQAGSIERFDAHQQDLPTALRCCSTHAFSIAETIALARTLEVLPPHLIVYGIEGETFDYGNRLSPAVAQAVAEVVDRIAGEIEALQQTYAA